MPTVLDAFSLRRPLENPMEEIVLLLRTGFSGRVLFAGYVMPNSPPEAPVGGNVTVYTPQWVLRK